MHGGNKKNKEQFKGIKIRNYWINNLLNWTRIEVVIKVKRIQRKHDIYSS